MSTTTAGRKQDQPAPFIRYPGSKRKILRHLLKSLPDHLRSELHAAAFSMRCYAEPFFGCGAIGLDILNWLPSPQTTRVIINDLDHGISDLWLAVRDSPAELIRLITEFVPTAAAFYEFKELDGANGIDPVLRGFRKLALHQMSFSGLGFMSGGPLGGKKGRSEYNPRCRWNIHRINNRIRACHRLIRSFRSSDILCEDFEPVLSRLTSDAFAYLDPPYYRQGAALYKHAMNDNDHNRLAGLLRRVRFQWLLSYDDHPFIRDLYGWADIRAFDMTPTMQTVRRDGDKPQQRRKNSEIVICPRGA